MPTKSAPPSSLRGALPWLFALTAGVLLGLALLKFGNPVILDRLVTKPTTMVEFLIQPWPLKWGYCLLAGTALLGLAVGFRLPSQRHWVMWLPLGWFVWQLIAGQKTVDENLTNVTISHFAAVVACFALSLAVPLTPRQDGLLWAVLLPLYLCVLWTGFTQHYGGLEATRQYVYSTPGWEKLPAEHLKRLGSSRIFATLLYPNTLAGVILLLLPVMLVTTWRATRWLTPVTRAVLVGVTAYASLACLVWSGSKAGWLIALAVSLACILHAGLATKWKATVVCLFLAAGLGGFFARNAGYFAKGATSVSARFDYWNAGWKTAISHPWSGAGPGTFSVTYRRLKPPEAEMAQLAHNDYLEQASDSGVLGALSYATFVVGSLIVLHRRAKHDALSLAVWLGLLGWALQSFVEFGLYIPAVGWTAFWMVGWLWKTCPPPVKVAV